MDKLRCSWCLSYEHTDPCIWQETLEQALAPKVYRVPTLEEQRAFYEEFPEYATKR